MLTEPHWAGVNRLLDVYLQVSARDLVVMVFTSDSQEEASWVAVALQRRGVETKRVWAIPLRDPGFSQRLSAALPSPEALGARHLVLLTIENETLSHDDVLGAQLARYPKAQVKVYRAMSAGGLLFSDGLRVSPEDLTRRNTALLRALMPARRIRFTSASGSDLLINFDPRFRWISNRGHWRPGKVVILPAGEVATFPVSVDGEFVADFGFNANFHTTQDGRLTSTPVTLWLDEGRVVGSACPNGDVLAFINDCLRRFPCSNRVGEVGFGSNFGINMPVRQNSHLNERHPGLHLGLGESNQHPDLAGYQCETHLDLIASGGVVQFLDPPGRTIDLSHVELSDECHPGDTRDEDAYGADGTDVGVSDDCCSFPHRR